MLRTTLTGAHLLRAGELVTDVTRLAPLYGVELGDLLEAKSKAEKQALDDVVYAHAEARMDHAFATLDAALSATTLPTEAPNVTEIDAWLVATRLRRT